MQKNIYFIPCTQIKAGCPTYTTFLFVITDDRRCRLQNESILTHKAGKVLHVRKFNTLFLFFVLFLFFLFLSLCFFLLLFFPFPDALSPRLMVPFKRDVTYIPPPPERNQRAIASHRGWVGEQCCVSVSVPLLLIQSIQAQRGRCICLFLSKWYESRPESWP